MSTIAYDGKILASDRQATGGGTIYTAKKIFKEAKYILGFVGSLDQGMELREWYRNGAKLDNYPKFQENKDEFTTLIVAKKDLVVYYQNQPYPIPVLDKFTAWGSGGDFAMAAMEMGADAKRAVEVACKFDAFSGQGVEAYEIS